MSSAEPHQHAPGDHHRPDRDDGHDHGRRGDHHDEHEHATGVKGLFLSIFSPHSHDSADSIDDALESNDAGIRAVKISLVALGVIAVAQLLVVILTGSVALLADTIHNFSDALTAVPLWIAFVLARRKPTRRYTYGYGRAEDLAGLFVVAMITLSAILAGYESIRRLIDQQPITHVWIVFAAGLIGFAGNELVAVYRIRVGRQIGSAALVADGLHARTDGFTSLAVALGAIGVMLGFPLADPIVGIVITLAILAVLKGAVVEVFRRLMDGVDPKVVAATEQALADSPGVAGVQRLRMRWDGHRLTAEADITVDPALTLPAARAIAHAAEHRVLDTVPKLVVADVHAYPVREPAHVH